MKVVVSLLVCLFLLFENLLAQTTVEEIPAHCTKENAPSKDKLNAFIGWPYALDCSLFFKGEDYGIYDLYEHDDFDPEENVNCEIRDGNGSLLLNSSSSFEALQFSPEDTGVVILPDLKASDNVDFNLTLKVPALSKCLYMNIKLQLTAFQEQTCQDFLSEGLARPVPSSEGGLKIFNCDVQRDVYPKLNSIPNEGEFVYSWKRNCLQLPAGVTPYNENTSLRIPSLSFDQGGVYSCAVEYKGMTRFLSSSSVCVQHRPTFVVPSFVCKQSEYYETLGNNVVIQCVANFGTGSVSETSFSVRWKNHQANATNSRIFCRKQTASGSLVSKTSCSYKLPERKCYFSPPSDEDRIPSSALVEVKLVIRNVQLSDFGIYESILGVTIEEFSSVKTNITIVQQYEITDPNPNLSGLSLSVIVGIVIGGIVFIVLALLACLSCMKINNKHLRKLEEEKSDKMVTV